jgi:hypothetical protein
VKKIRKKVVKKELPFFVFAFALSFIITSFICYFFFESF